MIGSMKHRITLTRPKRIDNGRGGWKLDYETGDKMEVWAAAEILTIDQQLKYQEHQQGANIRFEVRENPFIETDTQIEFNGDKYAISQLAPTRTRFMEIRAREV